MAKPAELSFSSNSGNEDSLALKGLSLAVSQLGGSTRAGQEKMAQKVWQTQQNRSIALIEAGTGTGKSLGYLIPTALTVAGEGTRAVISTATLALQRQILLKDAPIAVKVAKELTKRDLKVAVLKGWHHYLCRYKLAGGYPGQADRAEISDLLDTLLHQSANDPNLDESGDLKPLQDHNEEESQASGEGRNQRQDDAGAPSQNQSQNGVQYQEDPATSSAYNVCDPEQIAGERITDQLKRILAWSKKTKTGDRDDLYPGVGGRAWSNASVSSRECLHESCPFSTDCFAIKARNQAMSADLVITNHSVLGVQTNNSVLPEYEHLVVDESHALIERVTSQQTIELTASMLYKVASTARSAGALVLSFETAAETLLTELDLFPLGRMTPGPWPKPFAQALTQLDLETRTLLSSLRAENNSDAQKSSHRLLAKTALEDLLDTLDFLSSDQVSSGQLVVWINEQSGTRHLYAAPLDVSGPIANSLYKEHSVVLTSATLLAGRKPPAAAANLGVLADDEWDYLDVGTPFNSKQQAILYVPTHVSAPTREGISSDAIEEMVSLVRASRGGALGLFTSNKAIENAAQVLRERLPDLPIYVQGEGQLPQLVEQYALNPAACLLGTISLWQGVDVPGLTSRLVFIDRIPFPRPDEPIVAARCERVNKQGKSGFMQVSVVAASLLLAQGTGRLLRRTDDKGVVAVLDPRLATARYGSLLRSSLLPMHETADKELVCQALQRLGAIAIDIKNTGAA